MLAHYQDLLNDRKYHDLEFRIVNPKRALVRVGCHAAVVYTRCPALVAPPKVTKKKKTFLCYSLKWKNAYKASLEALLQYFYTGLIDCDKLSPQAYVSLVQSATVLKLDHLSYLCELWLKAMTMEICIPIFKVASKRGEERIQSICMHSFGKSAVNYEQFVSRGNASKLLGSKLFRYVCNTLGDNIPIPEPSSIYEIEGPPDNLVADLKKMYETMPYSEFSIICPNGEAIPCHRAIVRAYSKNLFSIFKDSSSHCLASTDIHSLLKFIYYGDDEFALSTAQQLIQFSKNHALRSLGEVCRNRIKFLEQDKKASLEKQYDSNEMEELSYEYYPELPTYNGTFEM